MILSVIGIGFALERIFNLSRKTVAPEGFADQAHALWEKKDYNGLTGFCENNASVLARIVRAIVDHRDCAVADVQTLAGDLGSREMRLHLQRAYPLAIIATLSPLLGLLGTVIGMIGAFDTVAAVGEMGDASILANDIAKALITTAAGLLVGIPALGLYHLFKSRTSSLAVLLEEETSEIINAWMLKPSRAPAQLEASSEEGSSGAN
jgi:biopolymer transport protein ExbB